MPVTIVQAKVSSSGAGTTQDFLDAGISSVKGYILLSNSGATVDVVRNHAPISIGFCDITPNEFCYSAHSLNRGLTSDDVVADHKGRTGDSLSIYDESTTPGDRLVMSFNSTQATGFRLNIDTMDSTAAGDRPQVSMAIFHGTQNFKVGKVANDDISNQDISLGFQPKALVIVCLPEGEDFDNTSHPDGMLAIGLLAFNNPGTDIAAQYSLAHYEDSGVAASTAIYASLTGACLQDAQGAQFNVMEYIANGFRVPAGSPTFMYAAWDWPTTPGVSDVRLIEQTIPAATGAFNFGVGHTSQFAFGVFNGLDAAAWDAGAASPHQTGQVTLYMATAAAQNGVAYSVDVGNATPSTRCVFTDAAGTDRALGILIEGAATGTLDSARGAIASHTANNSTKIAMSLDAQPFTLGNRGILLSCGRDPIRASILKAKIRKAKIR